MKFVFNTKNKIILGVVGFAVLSFIVIAIAINSNKTDSADLSSSVDSVVTSVEVSAETSFIPEQSSEVETSEVTSEDISIAKESTVSKTKAVSENVAVNTQQTENTPESDDPKESSSNKIQSFMVHLISNTYSDNDFGTIEFKKTAISFHENFHDNTVLVTCAIHLKTSTTKISFDVENTYITTSGKTKSPLDSYELDENGLSTLHFSSVDLKAGTKYTLTYVLKDEQTNTTMEPVTVWIDF